MSPILAESEQVILCAGANRSLGFAILQATSLHLPSATYILGCRSKTAGNEAVSELRKLGVTSKIEVVELDVTEDASIFAAVKFIQEKFSKLDGKPLPCNIALHIMTNKSHDSFDQQRRHSPHPYVSL